MIRALCLALLLALAPSCNNDCADVTCKPTLYLDGKPDLSAAGNRLSVHACLNARCSDAVLDRSAGACATLDISQDSTLCIQSGTVTLTISSVGGDPPLADGDTVVLRIGAEAGGAPLVDVTQSVTYQDVSPDPGCGGSCKAAQLSF